MDRNHFLPIDFQQPHVPLVHPSFVVMKTLGRGPSDEESGLYSANLAFRCRTCRQLLRVPREDLWPFSFRLHLANPTSCHDMSVEKAVDRLWAFGVIQRCTGARRVPNVMLSYLL